MFAGQCIRTEQIWYQTTTIAGTLNGFFSEVPFIFWIIKKKTFYNTKYSSKEKWKRVQKQRANKNNQSTEQIKSIHTP